MHQVRIIVAIVLLAGTLLPTISSTDDSILLAAALQDLPSTDPPDSMDRPAGCQQLPDATFWVQFEHLNFSTLSAMAPEICSAGMVAFAEPLFHSPPSIQPAGRDPPALI